ncbi:hypothetical protein DLAC_09057 [Tieghemostelium lacteum]|uniref:Sodium/calcium exchanger membrane region domain-containing protein n=1 Tax=Tieghemostelium lacteum TaxID=361077 RepID=A0A151Z907_TIELA|nr:hypothetical protein DLAC_09057 [Tieghemostelium lacteum]|eukprot:KYQ90435.1 hypothetical protein DLAC_09057 [Tieghemostelium lacteum]
MMKITILSILLLSILSINSIEGYTDISNSDNTCDLCSASVLNYYCQENNKCITNVTYDFVSEWPTCSKGWCNSDSCACEMQSIWPTSGSLVGMLFLMLIYGCVLAFGAKLISDGSELLMEILDPGVIGGLVLPFLSAFPDAMIILVSGAFGPDPQSQLSIGIGTLAGSTVMLLTIPTSLALIFARTDLKDDGKGSSIDGKLTHKYSVTKTGTTVDEDTQLNAKIMMVSAISYFIIQGVAFAYLKSPEAGQHVEKWFALVGMIVCIGVMAAYCTYQVISPKLQEKKIAEAKKKYLMERTVHHFIHNLTKRPIFPPKNADESSSNNNENSSEQSPLISNEHKKLPVDIKKFGMKWKTKALEKPDESSKDSSIQVDEKKDDSDDEKEEKEHSHPIDKKKIAIRSCITLLAGAVLVSVFSDPMVGVITDLGNKLNIGLFYISFVVTPFCSNASELISSLIFASKKKKANSSLTFSALYGSSTMNNCMSLGLFYALVFFRNLTWEFSAETITILFVTVCVGTIGAKFTTLKTYFAPILLSFYPLSLLLVYLLETYAHWQ